LARYIQDLLLDEAGLLRNRGTIQPAVTVVDLRRTRGRDHADDQPGRYAQGRRPPRRTGKFGGHERRLHRVHRCGTWPTDALDAPYSLFDAKPRSAPVPDRRRPQYGSTKQLAHWRGAEKVAYSTGTVTVTRGSTAVTGAGTSWAANVGPGMFLFATADDPAGVSVFIGVVKSVQSDTALTLGERRAVQRDDGHVQRSRCVR
jgi:hypothetical protein